MPVIAAPKLPEENQKVLWRQTGSCFDTTRSENSIVVRPGTHRPNPNRVDQSVFNGFHKQTRVKTPCQYQKKGTTVLGKKTAALVLSNNKIGSGSPIRPRSVATGSRANPANTEFRRFYERGDLPISLEHGGVENKIMWKMEIEHLDYHHYMPLFFSGLREIEAPYNFLATRGIYDMLEANSYANGSVLAVLPQLIIPIKEALNTRNKEVLVKTLKVLQELAKCENFIGQALVPYYRQILPVLNIFYRDTQNIGDNIVYGQRYEENLADLIEQTLQIFEERGGEDAFINIKYMIPTYQSIKG